MHVCLVSLYVAVNLALLAQRNNKSLNHIWYDV